MKGNAKKSIMNKQSTTDPSSSPHIGTLNEGSLHASLKQYISQAGDKFEVPINGFVIDVVRQTNPEITILIEIQTKSFLAMKKKLVSLLDKYPIHIVYPVAKETLLIKPDKKPRKSPKKYSVISIFEELVSIPELVSHQNLSFEVVSVSVTKIQQYDSSLRRGRGGYRTVSTELSEIHSAHLFEGIDDFLNLLPKDLPSVFTTSDIASCANISRQSAQQIAYCFRKAGIFQELSQTKAGKHYKIRE